MTTETDARAPIVRMYDLGDLSDAGYATTIAASPDELTRLAQWEAVETVNRFEGSVTLRRMSQARFIYRADLVAEIVQNCVVTLQPLTTIITRNFSRTLQYIPRQEGDKGGEITLSAGDDEAPEVIDSLRFDLAAPLLEEFSLAIDPYPRAPGVEFEAPAEGRAAAESPFSALKGFGRG